MNVQWKENGTLHKKDRLKQKREEKRRNGKINRCIARQWYLFVDSNVNSSTSSTEATAATKTAAHTVAWQKHAISSWMTANEYSIKRIFYLSIIWFGWITFGLWTIPSFSLQILFNFFFCIVLRLRFLSFAVYSV